MGHARCRASDGPHDGSVRTLPLERVVRMQYWSWSEASDHCRMWAGSILGRRALTLVFGVDPPESVQRGTAIPDDARVPSVRVIGPRDAAPSFRSSSVLDESPHEQTSRSGEYDTCNVAQSRKDTSPCDHDCADHTPLPGFCMDQSQPDGGTSTVWHQISSLVDEDKWLDDNPRWMERAHPTQL